MLAIRVAMVALLVACAGLAHAEESLQDIDNNEVLPENDVVMARVDEVPATTVVPPGSSGIPETTPMPTADPAEGSTTPKETAPPSTAAPPKQPSSLGDFLTEIIQFPIAVLRSVGSLLRDTFSSDRRTTATTTTAAPIDA
ncbi:uncharacterized protein LOC117645159 [Thrips palmi]|uniref:Uncharacterized protein LOC117645159 n=1 Tax=Thrips palmi TaxID=161013 RepID=A0A6P8YM68_THRPL|nr:uncharacterized protein LOC117645159 [Thrips palmi]XP_034241033.1 uncharacterized protein LOC117645159 [Thrips palmi]